MFTFTFYIDNANVNSSSVFIPFILRSNQSQQFQIHFGCLFEQYSPVHGHVIKQLILFPHIPIRFKPVCNTVSTFSRLYNIFICHSKLLPKVISFPIKNFLARCLLINKLRNVNGTCTAVFKIKNYHTKYSLHKNDFHHPFSEMLKSYRIKFIKRCSQQWIKKERNFKIIIKRCSQ